MDKRDAVDDSWEAIERRTALLLSEPLSLINQDNPCLTLLATI